MLQKNNSSIDSLNITIPPMSDQLKLIKYLDEFGKQILIRKSNNSGLEQQLASLSKAYNQAQQKLLETQRALMTQTLLLEKHRSIIQIYKYILNESMEDETIVTFIHHLQEENDDKHSILDELNEINAIINKKKVTNYKKSSEEVKAIKELRKQITRLHQDRKGSQENSEDMNNQNYQLKLQTSKLEKQMEEVRRENNQLQKALGLKQKKLDQLEKRLKEHQSRLAQGSIQIQQKKSQNARLLKEQSRLKLLQSQYEQFIHLFKQKLNIDINGTQKQNRKQNQRVEHQSKSYYKEGHNQTIKLIDQKVSQLLKYRHMYKKQKYNLEMNDFFRRQISILKLFLSDEALKLTKQFEEQKMECLENELRNLAALERSRFFKLQQNEKEVWKYKIKLLKEEDEHFSTGNSTWNKNMNSFNSKSRMLSSKQASAMLQSLKVYGQQQSKDQIDLMAKIPYDISQFNQ